MEFDEQPIQRKENNNMIKRAKFLYRDRDGILEYSYRGHTYSVNPNLYTSTAQQHRNEQLCIDAQIEREKKAVKPHRYEDTAEYGFEQFWKYVEGE